MWAQISNQTSRLVVATSLLIILTACICRANSLPQPELEPQERGHVQLPKLFDFDNYKRLFRKQYGSFMEELNRRRLFFGRALRAFVTNMRYKFRQRDHYESVNHMSDYSSAELDQLRNKVRAMEAARDSGEGGGLGAQTNDGGELPDFTPGRNEDVEEELQKLVEEHGDEPGISDLRQALDQGRARRRLKRDAGSAAQDDLALKRPRSLPKLINTNDDDDDDDESSARVVARPESNNPQYEPIDLPSFGLRDQQVDLTWWDVPEEADSYPVGEQLYYTLAGLSSDSERLARLVARDRRLANVMFVDHSSGGCMNKPRSQTGCGCCYAFASVAIMEWLYCKKTGQLVEFSEQYMVDCGKGRFETRTESLDGCEGASDKAVARFIHNFGMELRDNYPYAAREQQCPYEEEYDLRKTGYIRMELADAMFVQRANLEQYVKSQPLMIAVHTDDSFVQYGGGVDDGSQCGPEPDHSMVLVGHGREDGQEFWLIRNSFGATWGERGYYKLAKSATRKCIDKESLALGTSDGKSFDFEPKRAPK